MYKIDHVGTKDPQNNFDFLRLIFAISVIITHSYPLSGEPEKDWLYHFTNGQAVFSYIGVRGFFVISGYLIYQSLLRSKTFINFHWKRILRLFPALLVVIVLCQLFCVFAYDGSLINYYSNLSVWTYLPSNITLFRLQYTIDGVFVSNPYSEVINGSLWTIPFEFFLYILISLFFFIKRQLHLVLLGSLFILFNFFHFQWPNALNFFNTILAGSHLINLGAYFLAGSILANIRIENIIKNIIWPLASIIVLILAFYFYIFEYVQFIILPICIILISIYPIKSIANLSSKIGDLSYGIYLYAFPIQQMLVYYYQFSSEILMISTFIIVIPFALASWQVIEKKALRYKKLL